MVHYEITIKGRVQGVGFRQFVKDRARDFGINGWVKNMPDGSVFVKAEGDDKDMEPFLDHLKRGPSMSRVDNFLKNKLNMTSGLSGFSIKY